MDQGKIAENAQNEIAAKNAAGTAQTAADKASQFTKLVLATKDLVEVESGHNQLREEISKSADIVVKASRQTDAAAQSVKLGAAKN